MSRHVLALMVAAALAGCGGSYARSAAGPSAPAGKGSPEAGIGVEAAALPFRVLRARGGAEIEPQAFYDELGAARAICVGETHPNPHDHWVQLQILDQLTRRSGGAGVRTALGMEMFQLPFQGVLDDFAAGRIDEKALLSRSGWAERWGFDFGLYRPMVVLAVERKADLVALNTPRELVKKVSRRGIDQLSAAERAELPEMDLDDADHRAWWDDLMGAMGGAHGHGHGGHGHGGAELSEEEAAARAERIYSAQVLWDETMAATAVDWLKAGPNRQIVILAGTGHCHDSGIVGRIKRRGIGEVVSVRPVIDDGEGNVAALLAAPNNDYLFVMTTAED